MLHRSFKKKCPLRSWTSCLASAANDVSLSLSLSRSSSSFLLFATLLFIGPLVARRTYDRVGFALLPLPLRSVRPFFDTCEKATWQPLCRQIADRSISSILSRSTFPGLPPDSLLIEFDAIGCAKAIFHCSEVGTESMLSSCVSLSLLFPWNDEVFISF